MKNVKSFDITAVGECLIDLSASASGDGLSVDLKGNPGGAPANVLAAASRLGMKTAFAGKVGSDIFAEVLRRTLVSCGIDTSGLICGREPTTLAVVSLDEAGERSFSFYRERTADVMLSADEVNMELITDTRIFHFGSVSLTAEPSASATLAAAKEAKKAGARISFDPNLRPLLWRDLSLAKEQILLGMETADFVKVSEEELYFCVGESDPKRAAEKLMDEKGLKLLAVTMGAKGCLCMTRDKAVIREGYKVICKDSTGAGDAFWGTVLAYMVSRNTYPEDLTKEGLEELAAAANAAGALAVQKQGAIPAMPYPSDITQLCGTVF